MIQSAGEKSSTRLCRSVDHHSGRVLAPPRCQQPSRLSPSVGGVRVRARKKRKRIIFFMIWATLANANVQFNDLAFQRSKGGCIRSLTARNYADFFGGGVFCLMNCSFKSVSSSCLIVCCWKAGGGKVHEPRKQSRRLLGGNWEEWR